MPSLRNFTNLDFQILRHWLLNRWSLFSGFSLLSDWLVVRAFLCPDRTFKRILCVGDQAGRRAMSVIVKCCRCVLVVASKCQPSFTDISDFWSALVPEIALGSKRMILVHSVWEWHEYTSRYWEPVGDDWDESVVEIPRLKEMPTLPTH